MHYCPVCTLDSTWNESLVEYTKLSVCHAYSNLYLFHVNHVGDMQVNVTLMSNLGSNRIASWNATLNSTSLIACPCASLTSGAKLLMISPTPLRIYPGQFDVNLAHVVKSTLLVPIQDIMWAVEEVHSRWLKDHSVESEGPGSVQPYFKQWGCLRVPKLYRFLKYKSL